MIISTYKHHKERLSKLDKIAQLVLLPVILIAQNIEGKHTEIKADMDYEVDVETIELIKDMNRKIDVIAFRQKQDL